MANGKNPQNCLAVNIFAANMSNMGCMSACDHYRLLPRQHWADIIISATRLLVLLISTTIVSDREIGSHQAILQSAAWPLTILTVSSNQASSAHEAVSSHLADPGHFVCIRLYAVLPLEVMVRCAAAPQTPPNLGQLD